LGYWRKRRLSGGRGGLPENQQKTKPAAVLRRICPAQRRISASRDLERPFTDDHLAPIRPECRSFRLQSQSGRSGKLNFLVGLDSRDRLVVQLRPRCDALPAAWCSPVSQKRVHRPTPSAVPSVTTAIPWRVRASWKTNPMIAISCAGCRHCTRRTRPNSPAYWGFFNRRFWGIDRR
jgi:hypothetical protein